MTRPLLLNVRDEAELRGPEPVTAERREQARFKFARQKSKLAGTIRGSYFTFKDHC